MKNCFTTFILIFYLVSYISAVSRNKFRTCQNTGFCRRHIQHGDNKQDFLYEDYQLIDYNHNVSGLFVGKLQSKTHPKQKALSLELSITKIGAIHLEINEIDPLYKRYKVRNVIEDGISTEYKENIKYIDNALFVSNTMKIQNLIDIGLIK